MEDKAKELKLEPVQEKGEVEKKAPDNKEEKGEDQIIPPKEFRSVRSGIVVTIDGDDVTITFAGLIAEEVGCYRRVKSVQVKFKEGQNPKIIPLAGDGPISLQGR